MRTILTRAATVILMCVTASLAQLSHFGYPFRNCFIVGNSVNISPTTIIGTFTTLSLESSNPFPLPVGLGLTQSSGVISGIPTTPTTTSPIYPNLCRPYGIERNNNPLDADTIMIQVIAPSGACEVMCAPAVSLSPRPTMPLLHHSKQNFGLSQNGSLWYTLPRQSFVEARLFNLHGKEVSMVSMTAQEAGYHTIGLPGRLPQGSYILRFRTKDSQSSMKVILIGP